LPDEPNDRPDPAEGESPAGPNDRPDPAEGALPDQEPLIYVIVDGETFERPGLRTFFASSEKDSVAVDGCSCVPVAGTYCSCNKVCSCVPACACVSHMESSGGGSSGGGGSYGGGGGGGCRCAPVH